MKIKTVLLFLGLVIIVAGLAFSLNKMRGENNYVANQESQSGNNPFGFAGPSTPIDNFSKIEALGVKYARESMDWKIIEPKKDQYNFDILNQEGLLKQYNLEPIVRLKLGQFWATQCDISLCTKNQECPSKSADCPPKDLGTWSNKGYSPELYDIVYKTLENAQGKTQFEYIVVGNEANSLLFWNGSAEQYKKTLTTVYKAVKDFNKSKNTSYKVLDSGIASIVGYAITRENYCTNDQTKKDYALEFANRFFKRRVVTIDENYIRTHLNCSSPGRDYLILKSTFTKDPNLNEAPFDILGYHFYEPWDTQEEVINWFKNQMTINGYSPKPIMNTEGGYRDTLHLYSNTPSLAQDVANEIPKLHVVAFANKVMAWLWLPFTERNTEPFYGLEWKGLIDVNQKELPAYKSYKTMVAELSGFTKVEKVSGLNIKNIYKFSFDKNKTVYVLWNENQTQVDLSSQIKGDVKITRVDSSSANSKSSSINVSQEPIYVEKK